MSFGYSVGDCIALLQLVNKTRERFVDAPEQFKAISDEVRSLLIILEDVKVLLPQRDLTIEQRKELIDIFVGCYNVLDTLKETLDKYQELGSDPKGRDSKSLSFKVRRGWKRLRWEPEDVKELRSRITSNISLLNAFNEKLTKQAVYRLHERQDNRELCEEHQAILHWLTPIDYAPQQSDFISRRQEGTGEWLLKSREFQEWVRQSKQTLFCLGIPGAGKTIISAIVVDDLYTKFQNDASIGIAYLYCNFRRQQEQKPKDLLLSILKQLVQEQTSAPESLKSIYNRHKGKRTRPSVEETLKVLRSVVAGYSRTFIIIDALDECQVSDGGRQKIISEMFNIQAHTGANLFATSRFIPEIMKAFETAIPLEIRASNEDVRRYVDGHILELPLFVSRSINLQEEIKTEIIKAVDGMFLLAQLHLGSLVGKRSPKAIRLALKKLPTGSEAYDHAYKEAMERIEGQIADSQELAKQVLAWITCAKRPLTTLELQHALAVEIGASELDKENLPEIEDIVSVCAGLVTVDEESDIIRLVHYTTQQYFDRTKRNWFPSAETDITQTCVTYLSFNIFTSGFSPTHQEFEARLRLNPLYNYAARNWGHHARKASTEVQDLILDLLKSKAKVSAFSQAVMASRSHYNYSQEVPRQITGVHIAAYFGLIEVLITLLKNGGHLNCEDTYGQTPLWWAAKNGHEAVVKLLLAEDGVDLDSKDSQYGRTPLWWAAMNGHEAVVKLLLAKDGVNPDSKDRRYSRTPLSWAAMNGHEAVVKLLLAKDGVDADSKDSQYGRTPLSWAAMTGHEAVVKLLLAKDGVDPDSKDSQHGLTPLWWAAMNGHEAVVKLLLAKDGVDVDSQDSPYGRTPLWWAAINGHEAVVKLLQSHYNLPL